MLPFLALALQAAAPAPALPAGAELRAAIVAADARLFHLVFDACDPAALAPMIAPDFEFYHDKDGVVATDGAAFVADYAKDCAARKAPDAWRSRREIVTASLAVEAIPGFGAVEEGDHSFYERRGDGPERLAGRAHFVHLWKLTPAGWQLARVLSYGHRAAEAK